MSKAWDSLCAELAVIGFRQAGLRNGPPAEKYNYARASV
jgi:hypothetical protein